MNTIKTYAQLKIKQAEINDKLRELELEVLRELTQQGLDRITLAIGSLSLVHRKNWIYSDKVDNLAKKLKDTKTIEEIKGIATFTESLGLMFKKYD